VKVLLSVPVCGLAVILLMLISPAPRIVRLPAGVIEVASEMVIEPGTEVRGALSGTVLHAASNFSGRAVIVVRTGQVVLRDFTIDGNRDALETRAALAPSDTPFAHFTRANGILAEDVEGLIVDRVQFRHIAGFAVLASHSREVSIHRVQVTDSGSRNAAGRNNTTGGILLEEGSTDFSASRCTLLRIRGNGIWTHSLYTSPRNARGLIAANHFEEIGRDAIQAGHATEIRVENNTGERIGFPVEDVDMENRATPVGIDTAGNVDRSSYLRNRFSDINGKCIDLDGFHDGEVRGNTCRNARPPGDYPYGHFGVVMNNTNPDMRSQNIRIEDNLIDGAKFGGIFVIGTGHRVMGNHLLNLNTAHCNENAARFGCYYAPGEPDMLRSGIYLGKGAERPAPAEGNTIEDNEITGYEMKERCIALAPGIPPGSNTIRDNRCR
jgi:hypothetical protein